MSNRTHAGATPLIRLAHGSLHRIVDGQGTRVACLADSVWITQEGDRRDIVLTAGESFRIERSGLTLVMALGDAAIALLPPEPAEAAAA
jgi:ferric-dicitrate binding protein FerR (iron transport regulator)